MSQLQKHTDLLGFYKAPISFAFFLFYLCGSCIHAILEASHPRVRTLYDGRGYRYHPLVEFIISTAFINYLHVAFGMLVIYRFRFIERFFGSRKFGAFCVLNIILANVLLQSFYYGKRALWPIVYRSLSPYIYIGGVGCLYYLFMPKLQPKIYKIGPIQLSEKSYTYFAILTLLMSSSSVRLLILIGFVNGIMWNSFAPLKNFYLPSPIVKMFMVFRPFFEVTPPSVVQQRRRQRMQQRAQGRNPNERGERLIPGSGPPSPMTFPSQRAAPAENRPTAAIPETSIQTLIDMGFSRERAMEALRRSENNVEQALNYLLSS